MRTPYKPLNERDYLRSQQQYGHNNILTLGNGIGDITIFKDRRLRKGTGAFTNLIFKYGRKILPYLSKFLWPSVKEFSKNVAGDVMSGDTNIKQSLKNRGKQSLKRVGERILRGEGKKRKKRRKHVKRLKNVRGGSKKKKKVAPKKRMGGSKKKKKKKVISSSSSSRKKVVRRKKRGLKSHTMKSVDCSRPNMKKLCKRDIFSS